MDEFRLFLLTDGYANRTIDACLEFIKFFLAHNEFTNFYAGRFIANKRAGGAKNSTVNRYIDYLNTYARFIGDGSFALKHLKVEKSYTKKIFTDDQIDQFLNVPRSKCENPITYMRSKIFWTLCFYTGCRMSEIAGLTPDKFDFLRWEIDIENTKTYTSRKVPIAKVIQEEVYEYVSKIPHGQKVCYMSKESWRHAFNRRIKKIGMQKVGGLSAYSIRHTTATSLVKTAGIIPAKNILGHSNISTTEQYTHYDTQALHDAINSMSYAQSALSAKEKLDIFLRDVVKVFFWDTEKFEVVVKKKESELGLTIKAVDDIKDGKISRN